MDNTVQLLLNHDATKPIGAVWVEEGKVVFEFFKDAKITRENLFTIFGGAGIQITDTAWEDGAMIIRKGVILEFSLSADATAVPTEASAKDLVDIQIAVAEVLSVLSSGRVELASQKLHALMLALRTKE